MAGGGGCWLWWGGVSRLSPPFPVLKGPPRGGGGGGGQCKDHPKDHPGVLFTPEVMFTMNRGNRFVDKESLSSNRDVSWAKKGFARN